MKLFLVLICILAGIVCLALLVAYICFRMAFYSKRDKRGNSSVLPMGEIYAKYADVMKNWTEKVSKIKYEEITITSFDGLKLYGKYYEFSPDSPMEIMFHGYRGSAERDLCGGVERCFKLGRSVIITDQRGNGRSGGNVITFGVNESIDCASWAKYAAERFGKDRKIILSGISMGASTVMMATARELPESVVCVLADCGYTSARDIIKKVIREMKLPADILYPFVVLGARLYGKFDLESLTPKKAVASSKIPVILFHGEKDGFVPCEMSYENYDACVSEKAVVTIPNAEHGMSYLVDGKLYLEKVAEFSAKIGLDTYVYEGDILTERGIACGK